MKLLVRDYKRIEYIQKKLVEETATNNEVQEFLELIKKSGNEAEMSDYVKNIGFNSLNEFKQRLNQKNKNEDFIKGLAVIGGAILLSWLLTR